MFVRYLNMGLPLRQSAFLWGARQSGKSSFLKTTYPESVYYDLLDTQQQMRLTRSPHLLRTEILALPQAALQQPIIIDEFQKVPALLDEIHWLIENTQAYFILCGSSARKLKMCSPNLLGGRAWLYHFFPLVSCEIPDFDLLRALQHGLLPKHYLASTDALVRHLEAYVAVYLSEEIRKEGLVRNLANFSKFLEVAGLCNGEMLNFNNIARDCGIDRSTVKGYFQILEDTFMGSFISPFAKKVKRELIISAPKFYFFDVGVANYLGGRAVVSLKGAAAGKSFEHFMWMELMAYCGLSQKREKITYWRTKQGAEVDFIVGDAKLAIELKISEQVHASELKGLISFCEEHPETIPMVVSQDARQRLLVINEQCKIRIYPWREFLAELWAGMLF